MPSDTHFDLAVIGGGSGGIAAALAAARLGVRTVVVERGAELGGNATMGGVNCWEMGCGGTGIPFDIYCRLKRDYPHAVGIYSFGRHFCWQDAWYWPHRLDKVNFPGGECLLDPARRYLDTLLRHKDDGQPMNEAWQREHHHGVPFLPGPMAATIQTMLRELGVTLLTGVAFTAVSATADRVQSVTLADGRMLSADAWVDGTGGNFAHAAGCATERGLDPRSRYGEPGAPEAASDRLNAVTLTFRVGPALGAPQVRPLPADIPATCWWAGQFPPMQSVQYPNGEYYINMLPTMEGRDRVRLGDEAAYTECRRRVLAHWHFVQTHWAEFRALQITHIAPVLGIREDRRVVAEYMLTEHDVRRGLSQQSDPDLIALADHALDRHGEGGHCPDLTQPYGVPYRCLIPRGMTNLLVASRGAGFSSIAASSCRLTRTMMQLGQAAGTAVALARELGVALPSVPPATLRARLAAQHVQLTWPMSPALRAHLAAEPA